LVIKLLSLPPSSEAINGIAFSNADNLLLFTDDKENLYAYNFEEDPNIIGNGVTDLYDTVSGIHYVVGGIIASSGTNNPANGNYGLISFNIK
jgi:hypothetical protein